MSAWLRTLALSHPDVEALARRLLSWVPHRHRLGPVFAHWYSLLLTAEQWDDAQMEACQRGLLVDLMGKVAATNPYYRERLGSTPAATMANDLAAHLPVMTRSEFSGQYHRIRDPSFTAPVSMASTSGTSGNALQFAHARSDNRREWAAICHQWRRVGYDPFRSVRAEFRSLVPDGSIVQGFPDSNMLRCSILHLRAAHVRHYAQTCARAGVEFIHGYPSAIALLSGEMLASGIAFGGIRGIMLASEMVYAHQLDLIRAAFPQARLIAHYGNAERVGLGAWCEHEQTYHFLPLYAHVEVDPLDGALIGTNLFNTVNPFLRYRMSDVIAGARNTRCPSCGRIAMPLANAIEGRAEDYLFSPQRGWIPPAIVTYPLKALRRVNEMQFYQRVPDAVELRYTARTAAECTAEIDEVCRGLRKILGDVDIRPVRLEALERGRSGKLKWIVSELHAPGETPSCRAP